MRFKENNLFYTPTSQEELVERITELAKSSGSPAAVWTAVMMFQNFVAVEMTEESSNA